MNMNGSPAWEGPEPMPTMLTRLLLMWRDNHGSSEGSASCSINVLSKQWGSWDRGQKEGVEYASNISNHCLERVKKKRMSHISA
jgi:hypothetical protein